MNDQILDLAAAGKSQREIATDLSISVGKVNKVIQNARRARARWDGVPGKGSRDHHALDHVDARTLGALRVLGRATARDLAAFILVNSSTKEPLGDAHVQFIRQSLERLAGLEFPYHRVTVDINGTYGWPSPSVGGCKDSPNALAHVASR